MQNKLQDLVDLCKCEVTLTVNEHKVYYQTVEQWLNEDRDKDEVSEDTRANMIASDSVVTLQWYPRTPVGFYRIIDATIDGAINRALETFKDE